MARYGRSAESMFFEGHQEKLRMPTGDLFEDNILDQVLLCIRDANRSRRGKGHPAIAVYPHEKLDANDRLRWTDLKLVDYGAVLAPYAGHLRLDITHDFSGKDNMPILVTPAKPVVLTDAAPELKFGIRVGNRTKAFDDPVVVVGMDADPKTIRRIEERGGFYSALRSKMPAILKTAGGAIQEYRRLADPDYRAFLEKMGSKIPRPGVTLSKSKGGRSEVLNHKAGWYTDFGRTAKQLVSGSLGVSLSPIGGGGTAKSYIQRVNEEIARIDARDKAEQEAQDAKDGAYRRQGAMERRPVR